MNPIAINTVPVSFSALPAVLHEPSSNLMSIVPEFFRLFPGKLFGTEFLADQERAFLFRLYNFPDSLKREIEHIAALHLHAAIAESDDGSVDALTELLLNGIIADLEGPEAKCMKHALLRRGKNPHGCFSDN